MRARSFIIPALLVAIASPLAAQGRLTSAAIRPARAVHRDIPITNAIRRALVAGTRDSSGAPGRNYWQTAVEYSIDARLDPATSVVSGRETVVIHNNSSDSLTVLVLRLDQNLFAANVPKLESVPEITEGMKVTRLAVDGQNVNLTGEPPRPTRLAPAPALSQPVAEDLDQTVARIHLTRAIAPHASATMEAEWNFRVPKVEGERGERMGRWGDTLYQVGQWYPRVAMYDDLRGWDTDPYLGPSEFYNNFGRFDVRIDAPAGWIVGSTGTLQNASDVLTAEARDRLSHARDDDSTRTIVSAADIAAGRATAPGTRLVWHFVADSVADVAWAASNRFVWDETRATIPGRGPIPVEIMYLPGDAQGPSGRSGFAQAGPILRHALEFYSRLWMPYAFPKLTMVDGPELGMEYPMFIMSGYGAADHETGHQWWPMMVGVNETWYGWMDEGFNQYMNILSAADRMHQAPTLDGRGQSYGQISGNEQEAPLMWDANYGGPMYAFQAYGKAPMMLSSLGGIVGDTAVWRAMSGYAKAWRFKHPSPWDYAFFMSNALKNHASDLGWFWYYWLFTTDATDGSIANVKMSGTHTRVTVHQAGEMPSPVVLQIKFASTGPRIASVANARMIDSTTAEVTYPADVWFNGSRDFTADLNFGGRRIERIVLDPQRRFPDRDPTDNVWPRGAR